MENHEGFDGLSGQGIMNAFGIDDDRLKDWIKKGLQAYCSSNRNFSYLTPNRVHRKGGIKLRQPDIGATVDPSGEIDAANIFIMTHDLNKFLEKHPKLNPHYLKNIRRQMDNLARKKDDETDEQYWAKQDTPELRALNQEYFDATGENVSQLPVEYPKPAFQDLRVIDKPTKRANSQRRWGDARALANKIKGERLAAGKSAPFKTELSRMAKMKAIWSDDGAKVPSSEHIAKRVLAGYNRK